MASNLDSAFTNNLLANLIRFVANYESINEEYLFMTTNLENQDYTEAGENLGNIINYIIG